MYSATGWNQLGLKLGLYATTLSEIESDNNGKVKNCLMECLRAWLSQRDDVELKGGPKMSSLINALRKTGNNAIAIALEKEIPEKENEDIVEASAPSSVNVLRNRVNAPGM